MVDKILAEYGAVVLDRNAKRLVVQVDDKQLRPLAEKLFESGFYYANGVGVDERGLGHDFAMYHVFASEKDKLYLVVKVSTSNLKLPSITPVIPGSNWAEREAMDMLGLEFEGHPEPERLILPDDWPKGVYPLRKEFDYNERPEFAERKPESTPQRTDVVQLPLGPYHPALHEPEYFEIHVDGEVITDAKYRGFHIHRGMEKLAEGRLTLNQVPFLAERICGICGFTHSIAYCQAVADAAGLDWPERAKYIGVILLEIERLHSHLLWVGVVFHLLGFDSGFMHMWRIREKVMDIAEALTGNRKTYGLVLIGGMRRDIDESRKSWVLKTLTELREETERVSKDIFGMKELINRIKGIGVLPKEDARALGVLGPVARASGIDTDVRRDHPYLAYDKLDFKVPVYPEGDVLARLLVRYDEIIESFRLLEQALSDMPQGDVMIEDYTIPSGRIGLGATEAPRGEDVHFVITGVESKVYRWHPRAPTYNNLPSVPIMLRGNNIADAPIIIASIDPCFSCTDHVAIVRKGKVIWKGPLGEGVKQVGR